MSANENNHKPEETTNDQVGSEGGTEANGVAAAPGAAVEAPAAAAENLDDQLRKLRVEKEELWNQLVRRQADFENFRKRVEREVAEDVVAAVRFADESPFPESDALHDNVMVE